MDAASFEQFYQKNFQFLRDHLLFNTGLNAEEAEEIAQNTFVEAWEKVKDGEAVEHERALLKKVGTWRAIDYLRKQHGSSFDRNFVSVDETLVYSNPNESKLEVVFELDLLKKLISKVTNENHKRIIELHYFEHLSFREIANQLNISENTIHGHHRQLKRNFQRAFLGQD